MNKTQFIDSAYTTSEKGIVSLSSYEDSVIGVYKLTKWPAELPKTALAITQVIGSRKNAGTSSEYIRIEHADIFVNYEVFDFTTDDSWGYDLQTIILHEVGHMLGLYHDHGSLDESVMYPSITRYDENRYPKEKDIQNISAKYQINRAASSRMALIYDDEIRLLKSPLIFPMKTLWSCNTSFWQTEVKENQSSPRIMRRKNRSYCICCPV